MIKQITIDIPFQYEESEEWTYWILTNATYGGGVCLKVPSMYESFSALAKVQIQKCHTDALVTYRNGTEFLTIPEHSCETYGVPIFNFPLDAYRTDYYEKQYGWNCPQNFIQTEQQAKEILETLKRKFGYVESPEPGEYNYISPFGKFNF